MDADTTRYTLVDLLQQRKLPTSTVSRICSLINEQGESDIIAALIVYDIDDDIVNSIWDSAKLRVQLTLLNKRYICSFDRRDSDGSVLHRSFNRKESDVTDQHADLFLHVSHDETRVEIPSLGISYTKRIPKDKWASLLTDTVNEHFGTTLTQPLAKRPKTIEATDSIDLLTKNGLSGEWRKIIVRLIGKRNSQLPITQIRLLLPDTTVGVFKIWHSDKWFSVLANPLLLSDAQLAYLVKYFLRYCVSDEIDSKFQSAAALRRDKLLAACAEYVNPFFGTELAKNTFSAHFC